VCVRARACVCVRVCVCGESARTRSIFQPRYGRSFHLCLSIMPTRTCKRPDALTKTCTYTHTHTHTYAHTNTHIHEQPMPTESPIPGFVLNRRSPRGGIHMFAMPLRSPASATKPSPAPKGASPGNMSPPPPRLPGEYTQLCMHYMCMETHTWTPTYKRTNIHAYIHSRMCVSHTRHASCGCGCGCKYMCK